MGSYSNMTTEDVARQSQLMFELVFQIASAGNAGIRETVARALKNASEEFEAEGRDATMLRRAGQLLSTGPDQA